jgi:hypothetical protein
VESTLELVELCRDLPAQTAVADLVAGRSLHVPRYRREPHDVCVLFVACIVRIDVDNHDCSTIANEKALEYLGQARMAERYWCLFGLFAERGGSELLLVASEGLEALTEHLDVSSCECRVKSQVAVSSPLGID